MTKFFLLCLIHTSYALTVNDIQSLRRVALNEEAPVEERVSAVSKLRLSGVSVEALPLSDEQPKNLSDPYYFLYRYFYQEQCVEQKKFYKDMAKLSEKQHYNDQQKKDINAMFDVLLKKRWC